MAFVVTTSYDSAIITIPSRTALSIHHPLHFIEGDGIAAAVVEARGTGGFVAGHLLRHFKLSAVLQIGGDARGAEAVAGDLRRDPGGLRATLDHRVDVLFRERRAVRELTVPECREEGSGRLRPKSRRGEPSIEILF